MIETITITATRTDVERMVKGTTPPKELKQDLTNLEFGRSVNPNCWKWNEDKLKTQSVSDLYILYKLLCSYDKDKG